MKTTTYIEKPWRLMQLYSLSKKEYFVYYNDENRVLQPKLW